MSIAGGIANAVRRGAAVRCDTLALFSGSPRVWKRRVPAAEELTSYRRVLSSSGIYPVVLHALYLANLAAPDTTIRTRSIDTVAFELDLAELLGIRWVVVHPGSHRGNGIAFGIRQCAHSLDALFERSNARKVGVALETVSGAGYAVGSTFSELRDIIAHSAYRNRLSVCVDTCHIFAAGHDVRTPHGWNRTTLAMDQAYGLDRISVLHLNDSKTPLGSSVDRHTHIGEGFIGLEAFRAIVNDPWFRDVPMIIETPKGKDQALDRKNLQVLRSLVNRG